MLQPTLITLRQTIVEDLDHFFQFQLDEQAQYMAAFTPKDPTDRDGYISKWIKLLNDPSITMLTVLADLKVVGSVSKFVMNGEAEITYWLDKKYWGQGIATAALQRLLEIEKTRPIYGRVAFDNFGSQRVLEKCGFERIGTDKGFANARQAEIEEYIYCLPLQK
jgi:RimJ/RimL family protein N-acetyltransferase